jgi:hypothetical protein
LEKVSVQSHRILVLRSLVKLYGKHPIYTDSAVFYIEVRRSLSLVHRTYEFGDWFFEVIEKKYKRIELKSSTITFLGKFAD